MSYYEDSIKQLQTILDIHKEDLVKNKFSKKIKDIFNKIYAINYLSKRIEVRNNFKNDYYDVCFSCLLEAFSLIIKNYPRGASLVLRSCIENYQKFIIEYHNINKLFNIYSIDDRSYSANKATLDKVIKFSYKDKLQEKGLSLNTKLQEKYSRLSGLSHSLVPESRNNTLKYFSDLSILNVEMVNKVLEELSEISTHIFIFQTIICKDSLKLWDRNELSKLFRLVIRRKTTAENHISILKE